ncbi:pentatricopeptide repeat-containing protein At4g16835, mitochondrial-like [Salvia miltiorrhiza]|uniref:pentatricopeptide repeat-containing protein At4g16835, mitochondrial-like n=1 Tax=Salvia miltiorrhiza TaxID=226208 RepID=UPI0025ABC2CD|nr:pentatricopeptide repeat-containing protein At4g16835, mitochondrial-like [Salvia miltiorrhiza]
MSSCAQFLNLCSLRVFGGCEEGLRLNEKAKCGVVDCIDHWLRAKRRGDEVPQLYGEMRAAGVEPNFVTFIGLLLACSHAGLAERGRCYFDSVVRDYGVRPGHDHYMCTIGLLGRSGRVEEAEKLLSDMEFEPHLTAPSIPHIYAYFSFLIHFQIFVHSTFEHCLAHNFHNFILSNMYYAVGKWEEAASIRSSMKAKGVVKEPGQSWVEMSSTVHRLVVYLKVDEALTSIKAAGYVPDMSFSIHNINEEGKKAHGLAYHSEKLALAFCLLKLHEGVLGRIYKNVWVCGNCHSAMRIASRIYRQRIILKDSNRFHHW